jgi:hypothetical protein
MADDVQHRDRIVGAETFMAAGTEPGCYTVSLNNAEGRSYSLGLIYVWFMTGTRTRTVCVSSRKTQKISMGTLFYKKS